ncbi:Uncharacterized protein Adt_13308 [Abeliophyllum distichum]|uniref:Uncharacterized protein n=1 Tax=Abeliophyllum distichum TaxID=126358 RepID=A0ABD1TWF3_9LAMI
MNYELLKKWPHHEISPWMQIQTFYSVINNSTKTSIDCAAGGSLMNKIYGEDSEIFEDMASISYFNLKKKSGQIPESISNHVPSEVVMVMLNWDIFREVVAVVGGGMWMVGVAHVVINLGFGCCWVGRNCGRRKVGGGPVWLD